MVYTINTTCVKSFRICPECDSPALHTKVIIQVVHNGRPISHKTHFFCEKKCTKCSHVFSDDWSNIHRYGPILHNQVSHMDKDIAWSEQRLYHDELHNMFHDDAQEIKKIMPSHVVNQNDVSVPNPKKRKRASDSDIDM